MSSKNVKKSKIKNESETKCKIEKPDGGIHTLEFYIDDRLELIKQIFSSLKPKTIKSLAPPFLKESDIENIEELCLNELLGISKKRLQSIINAQDCPSNTESSDSDVENIEENISLEEISSDSNNERDKKGRKKNDSKRQKKIGKDQHEDNNLNENGKEISVLELLELQARARAIRSQLALEPIAKIEVDSEASDKEAIKVKKPTETKVNINTVQEQTASTSTDKSLKLVEEKISLFSNISLPNGIVTTNVEGTTRKRIKLKRNFRKRPSKSNLDEEPAIEPPSSLKQINNKEIEDIQQSKERSPSPDVFPIILSPEILCISDSDDEKNKPRKIEEARKIEKQTDEGKLISAAVSANNKIISKGSIEEIEDIDNSRNINKGELFEAEFNNNTKDSYEEGEISETEVNRENKIENGKEKVLERIEGSVDTIKNDASISESEIDTSTEIKDVKRLSPVTTKFKNEENQHNKSIEFVISSDDENNENSIKKPTEENDKQDDSDKNNESDVKESIERNNDILSSDDDKSNDSVIEKNYDSNDHNDDVISLNDDEDIELALEQKQCSENQRIKKENENKKEKNDKFPKLSKLQKLRHKIRNPNENYSSDSSSGEGSRKKTKSEDESTSWNNRWLRSSKVTKIMATSKLGSRLREKILKSKQAQQLEKQKSIEDIDTTTASDSPKSNYNFEDGSIQQYDELEKTKN